MQVEWDATMRRQVVQAADGPGDEAGEQGKPWAELLSESIGERDRMRWKGEEWPAVRRGMCDYKT